MKFSYRVTLFLTLLMAISANQLEADSLIRVNYKDHGNDLQKVLSSGFRTILHRPGLFIDVVVPQNRKNWTSDLSDSQVLHKDFDKYIKAISAARDFGSYHTEKEITNQLDQWEAQYPELVQKSIIGYGWNNRNHGGHSPIRMLTLGKPSANKPALLLFAGIHSRELSSTEILIRTVDRLLSESAYKDNSELSVFDAVTIYVIPCLNPDGRKLVFNGNIWWRKNCRPGKGSTIAGVDINRNFPFHFGKNSPYGGSSNSPDSETYRGPKPFSEPEARALRDVVIKHPEIVASISFHSYGGFILVPNGFNGQWPTEHCSLYRDVTDYITSNNEWPVGTVKEILGYYSNGRHDDWLYGARSALKKPVLALQLEIGDSFYPEAHKLKPISDKVVPLVTRLMARISAPPVISVKRKVIRNPITGLVDDSKETLVFSIKNNQFNIIQNLTARISLNHKTIKRIERTTLGGLLRGRQNVSINRSVVVAKNSYHNDNHCNVVMKWDGGSCNLSMPLPLTASSDNLPNNPDSIKKKARETVD